LSNQDRKQAGHGNNYAIDVFNAILNQQVRAASATRRKRAERTEGNVERLRGISEKGNNCAEKADKENQQADSSNQRCRDVHDAVNHPAQPEQTHDAVNHLSRSEQSHDAINHPSHYCQGGVECIDAIQAAVTGLDGPAAWLTGSIIKYVWRWSRKNGAEDLRKARFYLDRLIRIVEDREAEKYAAERLAGQKTAKCAKHFAKQIAEKYAGVYSTSASRQEGDV
jgi:hypothetical protein